MIVYESLNIFYLNFIYISIYILYKYHILNKYYPQLPVQLYKDKLDIFVTFRHAMSRLFSGSKLKALSFCIQQPFFLPTKLNDFLVSSDSTF